ncbi:MAG: DMT family transporter [Verrucomicrobiota bacterium]
MQPSPSRTAITGMLCVTVLLWGANNTGLKFLVGAWPPLWVICSRIWLVAAILFVLLRATRWFGEWTPVAPNIARAMWLRAGLTLAAYFTAITFSLRYISAPQMALHLATSPVWGLVWEQNQAGPRSDALRRYGAAFLALGGVAVLLWPKINFGVMDWHGDALAQIASILWTLYGRQCRGLAQGGNGLGGAQITCATMWRAAVWLTPATLWELAERGRLPVNGTLLGVHAYCTVFGGVVAFVLYTQALRYWPVSQVFLFNNLIPASTMAFSWLLMGEHVTGTFWLALLMVSGAVVAGQMPTPVHDTSPAKDA